MRTLTLLLLALVLVAGAETVTFQPGPGMGKDTFTRESQPDKNFGRGYYLWLSPSEYIFIEFIELNDAQYQGVTVDSACIWFTIRDKGEAGQFQIGPCNKAWDEDTITWNTMVGVHETDIVDYPTGSMLYLYITDWVQNWLDGTWDNNGIAMFDVDGGDNWSSIMSSNGTGDPSLRPKLVLEYTPSAIEEATWGQIKATF